ncbi:MAG: glycosyltransferase family 2 protein [Planctomycetota bacterium]
MASLTVLLPNHNDAERLPRALGAILSQSRPAERVLVVDDASTDGSRDVVRGLAAEHPGLELVELPENVGVAGAVRAGLERAETTHVYGAAADDRVLPGAFERAMGWAEREPGVGCISAAVEAVSVAGGSLGVQREPAWDAARAVSPAEALAHFERVPAGFSLCTATVYRRDAMVEAGGYRDELGPWSDTFLARTLALRYGMAYVPEPGAQWTVDPESYYHRTMRDPGAMRGIGERVHRLMRSEDFAGLFPEDHADRWRARWNVEMTGVLDGGETSLVRRELHELRRAYARASRHGKWIDRVLGGVLRAALRLHDRGAGGGAR